METYQRVRRRTEALCAPLATEDFVLQSMPDASPARWHLAHTTWFFETFLLVPHLPGYTPHEPGYEYLFNSYYNGVGAQFPRHLRGALSRPTVAEIFGWRAKVDDAMSQLLASDLEPSVRDLVTTGINHEQQHQELLLTDIKHALSQNPLDPAWDGCLALPQSTPRQPGVVHFDGGVVEVGDDGHGFHFDNEGPRHSALLQPFALSTQLVTNADWLCFMEDGGYETHDLWLSDGWALVQDNHWRAPLYWRRDHSAGRTPEKPAHGGVRQWTCFTLGGRRPIDPAAPVVHISFFEADAYARWAGARLPTEFEWEHAAATVDAWDGTFQGDVPHPVGAPSPIQDGLCHMFGEVWEWTASPYRPYPGYAPAPGALGEYNGKFMNGSYVLRGGSCATPRDHIRATYRNFFGPDKRWQFAGMRLAYDP